MEQTLKQEILNTFENKRIVSLLYFGTRAFNINTDCSDYDLFLILDKYQPGDTLKIKDIADKAIFQKIDLGLNWAYKKDLDTRGQENFQLRSLSPTFYKYLEDTQVLIGSNVFKDNPVRLSRKQISDHLDFKIQEYYGRCDKLYTKKCSSEKIFQQEAKYIRDILKYFLIMTDIAEIKDLTKLDLQLIKDLTIKEGYLNKTSIKNFSILERDFLTEEDLKTLEKVRRDIYTKYLLIRKNFLS